MIYIIVNSTGKIVQRIDALDSHAEHYERDGHTVLVSDEVIDIATNYVADSGFVPIPEKPSEFHDWDWPSLAWVENAARVAAAYVGQRRSAYPAIGDQLDALWKGGDALAAMQKQIIAVKAAYPKPQEGAGS